MNLKLDAECNKWVNIYNYTTTTQSICKTRNYQKEKYSIGVNFVIFTISFHKLIEFFPN